MILYRDLILRLANSINALRFQGCMVLMSPSDLEHPSDPSFSVCVCVCVLYAFKAPVRFPWPSWAINHPRMWDLLEAHVAVLGPLWEWGSCFEWARCESNDPFLSLCLLCLFACHGVQQQIYFLPDATAIALDFSAFSTMSHIIFYYL